MKRLLYPLIAGGLATIVVVLVPAARAEIDSLAFPDDVTLDDGLATTINLVNNTADALNPHLTFTPEPNNAKPEQAGELRNNHSISDHSDQRRFPGYDDCDHARNVFDDGWAARYRVSADYSDARHDPEAILALVRAHWESEGYAVQTFSEKQGTYTYQRLWIDTGYSLVQFNINPRRATVTIQGITDCLPPD